MENGADGSSGDYQLQGIHRRKYYKRNFCNAITFGKPYILRYREQIWSRFRSPAYAISMDTSNCW